MSGLAAIATRQPFGINAAHVLDDAVTDAVVAASGEWIAAGTAAGGVLRFDYAGNQTGDWQAHSSGVIRMRLQPGQGDQLATAGEDGRVMLWNCHDGVELGCLLDERSWVEHLAWTPDGSVLAVAARKTLSLWEGADALGMWYDAKRHILALAWAPDGRRLATAANKGLYLWRIGKAGNEAADPVQLLSFPGAPVSVAWQPNGGALAAGTQDGFLQIWRSSGLGRAGAKNRASQLTMKGYPSKVSRLSWHPSRPLIASAGGPDIVLWYLPRTGGNAKGQPLRHHGTTVTALGWSPDGSFLASGDRAGRLCIWNASGDALFTQTFNDEISVLRWFPDSKQLLIGDIAGGLCFLGQFDADPGKTPESPEAGARL